MLINRQSTRVPPDPVPLVCQRFDRMMFLLTAEERERVYAHVRAKDFAVLDREMLTNQNQDRRSVA